MSSPRRPRKPREADSGPPKLLPFGIPTEYLIVQIEVDILSTEQRDAFTAEIVALCKSRPEVSAKFMAARVLVDHAVRFRSKQYMDSFTKTKSQRKKATS